MAIAQQFPVNCIRVCLDEKGKDLKGVICAVALEDDLTFSNKREFIVKIDEAFDLIGQPQPHQVIRSFRKQDKLYKSYNGTPERFHTSDEIRQRSGGTFTFDLVMLSRHNAEWQGLVKETDGKLAFRFKSSLEFLSWIDELSAE